MKGTTRRKIVKKSGFFNGYKLPFKINLFAPIFAQRIESRNNLVEN